MALCAACHSGLGDGAEADVHGNQVGLLRQSKCYRNSPAMSCSTCHNIHRVERDLVAMSARCATCHAAPQHKRTTQADGNCIDCHMPRQESKVITFRTSGSQLAQQYRTHKIAIYEVEKLGVPIEPVAARQDFQVVWAFVPLQKEPEP